MPYQAMIGRGVRLGLHTNEKVIEMKTNLLMAGFGLTVVTAMGLGDRTYGNHGDQALGTDALAADKAIWHENFEKLKEGAMKDEGDTAWTSKTAYVGGMVGVKDGEYRVEYGVEELTWTSGKIDISKAESVKASVDVRGEGSIDDDPGTEDHFRIFAVVDGGKEVLLSKLEGYLDKEKYHLEKGGIKGKSLQLIIRVLTTGDDEIFSFDNVKVEAE